MKVSEFVQYDDKGRNAHSRAEILDENAFDEALTESMDPWGSRRAGT